MVDIRIEGIEELFEKLDGLVDTSKLENALGKACAVVERSAKQKAPKDTGALRREMTHEVQVTGTTIEGIVFNPVEYAPYVEYGTGIYAENGGTSGYWVYVGDKDYDPNRKKSGKRYTLQEAKKIVAIMRSKGLEAYYTNGMQPHPFLRPALNENKDEIIQIIKEALG